MTAKAQAPVHLLDPVQRRPACGSPVPFAWHWTERPARVTCPECRALFAGGDVADPADDALPTS